MYSTLLGWKCEHSLHKNLSLVLPTHKLKANWKIKINVIYHFSNSAIQITNWSLAGLRKCSHSLSFTTFYVTLTSGVVSLWHVSQEAAPVKPRWQCWDFPRLTEFNNSLWENKTPASQSLTQPSSQQVTITVTLRSIQNENRSQWKQ